MSSAGTVAVEALERPLIRLDRCTVDWPRLWDIVYGHLRRAGYSRETLRVYRQVLRAFSRQAGKRPRDITETDILDYVDRLCTPRLSWSWVSTNISVPRTVFDKLCGCNFVQTLQTPNRGHHLPEFLSRKDVCAVLEAGNTLRDQLLMGLLYGSGLKPGEACTMRWRDIDIVSRKIRVRYRRNRAQRLVGIPEDLLPVLNEGVQRCDTDGYVFPGRRAGAHLCTHSVGNIVRRAARAAGIAQPVSAMALRHTFAVDALEDGFSERQVQEALGHDDIDTTMRYTRCTLPADAVSPLDHRRQSKASAEAQAGPPDGVERAEADAEASHEQDREEPRTDRKLFSQPLSTAGLELPFRCEDTSWQSFCAAMRDRLRNRFLALREALRQPGG